MNKKNHEYLEWIREQPCIVCQGQSEPHHVRIDGNAGMGIKPDDEFSLPLCRDHHTESHALGRKSFWAKHMRLNIKNEPIESAVATGFLIKSAIYQHLFDHTMRYIQEKQNG